MESHTFILQLLTILICAKALGELASALKTPSVLGELVAGIIIGPSLLGWVEVNDLILILSEIGIILLLFEIGLDADINKLIRHGKKSVLVALGGFVAPTISGFVIAYYAFDLTIITSLFIGGTLSATSIGITVRTLSDVNRQNSTEGQIVLGAAVLDDLLGVILLSLLLEFSITGDISLLNASKVLSYVLVFFMIAPVLAKLLSHAISHLDQRNNSSGIVPVTIVSLVLFFAWLAHWFGAPELLGGFAAGIALSRRFFLPFGIALSANQQFSSKIKSQMTPIVQLFAPIFFVTIGLSMDLRTVNWNSSFFWWLSLTLVTVAIITKFIGALFINDSIHRRIIIGMSMVPRGEVGLIFAGVGITANAFTNDIYTALIMVIIYTTLLSPFWIKLYYKMFGELIKDDDGFNEEAKH